MGLWVWISFRQPTKVTTIHVIMHAHKFQLNVKF